MRTTLVDRHYKNQKSSNGKVHLHKIWTFNGFKFDLKYFITHLMHMFTCSFIGDDRNMKKLSFANIVFLDFCNIFVGTLKKLAKNWGVEHKKTSLKFSDIKYNKLHLESAIKEEAITYCYNDCQVLMDLFFKYKNELVNAGITETDSFFSATQLS